MKVTPLPVPSLPPGRPRVVLAGFMGTGKTSVGRVVAERLGLPMFDLDEVLASRVGEPVGPFFEAVGEPEFRRFEARVVDDAARLSAAVIATGGGAVLAERAFASLADGSFVFVLTAERDEIVRRVKGDSTDRPLVRDALAERVEELLERRGDAYARSGERFDTTSLSVEEVASVVLDRYRAAAGDRPAATVAIAVGDERSDVLIADGAADEVGARLTAAVPTAQTAALVFDRAVEGSAAARVHASLRGAGLRVASFAVPAGETAKSLAVLADLWTGLGREQVGRGDALVAVGGGATTDLAGFAAATYMRGIAHVNVPTTVLGMADAAIGGKVAIDHDGTKNLVGAFHHPRLVVVDPTMLETLSSREFRAGLAEVVKAFVVASPIAFATLASLDLRPPAEGGDADALMWALEQSIRVKAAFVAADPRDHELRHALNLGHTFAHAVEAASDYSILHGEAVAMGLVAASRLGDALGTAGVSPEEMRAALRRIGLPSEPPPGLAPDRLLDAFRSDKKRLSGRGTFVVPTSGGVALARDVPFEGALAALVPSTGDIAELCCFAYAPLGSEAST